MYSFDSLLRYWVWFCSKPESFCGKQSQKSLFSWNIHRIWETRNKQIIEKSNLSQMAVSAMRKKLSVKKLWKCSKREMRIESSQNRIPLLLTGGSDSRESICSAGDLGWILGSGRSPGERNDNSLWPQSSAKWTLINQSQMTEIAAVDNIINVLKLPL